MTADEIIEATRQLPTEEQLKVVDALYYWLEPLREEAEKLWAIEIPRRIEEIDSGAVEAIPAEEVFSEIRKRFGYDHLGL